MKLLAGKTAIVTGAARGIGEAIALKFAEHGANVAFTYVSDSSAEKAKALAEKMEAMGVKAKAYQSNAGDFAQCEQLVNDVLATFGSLDICVNNAGISKDNLLLRVTPEQWDEVMDINLKTGDAAHDEVQKRLHHQYEFHHWHQGKWRANELCGQ